MVAIVFKLFDRERDTWLLIDLSVCLVLLLQKQ